LLDLTKKEREIATELAGSKESSRGGGEDGEHLNLVTVARCLNPTKCTAWLLDDCRGIVSQNTPFQLPPRHIV